jgi:hypothetical protein
MESYLINMFRIIAVASLIVALLFSCSDKPKPGYPKNFVSLEISYTDGWTTAISFLVDSNGVFFSPATSDSIKYGIMPDSTFDIINISLGKIENDSTVTSRDDGCVDCSVLAMKAIFKTDTLTIRQVGEISPPLWTLVQTLKDFVGKSRHSLTHSVLFLETEKAVSPPLLPLDTKFTPPK